MEIPHDNTPCRTYIVTKKKVLKDGTVREYKYQKQYTPKTDRVECGKAELIKKITVCKDKEKIERIKQLFNELEM